MVLSGCSSGLVFTALVATILFVPVQYFGDDYASPEEAPESLPSSRLPVPQNATQAWLSLDVLSVDSFATASLALSALLVYVCDWIQRKLMERRILKLNQHLGQCLEKARSWDARQEQLERALALVQSATSEYQLLLHVLLRQHLRNMDINGLNYEYITNPV